MADDDFVFPPEHRWRQENFLATQREIVSRLRALADRVEREAVRIHSRRPSGLEHYGDEVTVAGSIASALIQGFNHAALPLDVLIRYAHDCAVVRWAPDQVRAEADAANLASLTARAAAVLASPSSRRAREALAAEVSRVQALAATPAPATPGGRS